MKFIDTHQHFIYRGVLGYGWTEEIPALAEGDFTLADYSRLTAGRGVIGSLFMETGVDDATYQAEARQMAGLVGQQGVLGQIASCRPETHDGFDAWLDECRGLNVLGFRRILHVVPDGVSQSTTFRSNLRKIGAQGLTFDMCFLARQLGIAVDLAKACDDQRLILDHCGVPDIAAGAFEDWARGISALAVLPHVCVKLSGIVAYAKPGNATLEALQPWVDHVIDRFGPARVVWGSDWPVVNLGTGLPDWIELTKHLLAGLPPRDQAAIASGNARRIYKIRSG